MNQTERHEVLISALAQLAERVGDSQEAGVDSYWIKDAILSRVEGHKWSEQPELLRDLDYLARNGTIKKANIFRFGDQPEEVYSLA